MPLPLDGVVVIDLSQIYNGPYATFLLAMSGATVVKIEPPGGESLRRRGSVGGAALPFALLNGCKRTIVLNLKTDEGKELLRELVRAGDVLVENFAPGVLDRLGVGAAALQSINPRLIYAQSSGYGTSGPYRDYPAMDLTVQAMSGVMSITGFPDRPPVKAGPALCDFFAGVHLYGAVVTALYERERTGVGRRVEVAMLDAVYPSLGSSLGLHFDTQGDVPPRTGNRHAGLAEAPYNVYPAADGHIAILCVSETHWRSLLHVMGRDDLAADPRFGSLASRVVNIEAVDATIAGWTQTRRKQELFETLMAGRVPCAPVRNLAEVVNDPHLHARGMLQWQDHPELGRIVVQHSPLRFDGDPQRPLEPSRTLGADTGRVLEETLGLTPERIQELAERGIV
ncbi:MAG TPA: CoA transferase [Acetobacteraceae bacterium]|jgi:formyl-CoA transferase|nr:CoA transferase [Acetobacteraceae bacterium]